MREQSRSRAGDVREAVTPPMGVSWGKNRTLGKERSMNSRVEPQTVGPI